MDKKTLSEALTKLKESAKKRNFKQTYEIIYTLKDLDFKKPEGQIDFFATLHNEKGRKIKTCALVGPELEAEAKKACDKTITQSEFPKYQNKADIKKLASEYDFFIAQANIMAQVASTFGKVFGPKGKMPNPKAGCVVPPKANLTSLVKKLQKTVRVNIKTSRMIQCPVGVEGMSDDEIIDNIITLHDQIIHHLPNEENNIKNIFLKLTMSKPVKVK